MDTFPLRDDCVQAEASGHVCGKSSNTSRSELYATQGIKQLHSRSLLGGVKVMHTTTFYQEFERGTGVYPP